MGLIESIRLAFASLAANKMRSLLTMLGIIIGISSVITITTIGNSIQQTLKNTFAQINMNMFYCYLSSRPYEENDEMTEDEYYDSMYLSEEDYITNDMINELLEKYPGKYKVIYSDDFGSGESVNYRNEYVKTVLIGSTDGAVEQSKLKILSGRNLTQRDNNEKKNTILVSDIFVRQYFNENENPVGKTVTFAVNGEETYDFTIVGVYEYSETKLTKFPAGTKEIDKVTQAFIPFNTAQKLKGETDSVYEFVGLLWSSDMSIEEAESNIKSFFDEKYEQNKYWSIYIENETQILSMIDKVIGIVTIAISVIAAISLIVGGVGVMNIMLVSITERTKEIGIRKALGAQNKSIRLQFVVEAIIICLIGGIIGILTGILNGVLIGNIATYFINSMSAEDTEMMEMVVISISPSLKAILVSVFFSMLTGVFFGYYPANKAAKMNPIDALRYD